MLAELRELAERMPVPDGAWHPHAALIREIRDELLETLERVDEETLEALLDGPVPVPEPGSALAALPIPEGRHPYLDEILPVLEAARRLQAASLPA